MLLILLIVLPHRFATVEPRPPLDVVLVTLPPEPADEPETPADPPEPPPETAPQPAGIAAEPAGASAAEPVADTADETSPPAPEQEEAEEDDDDAQGGGGMPLRPAELIGHARPLPGGSGPGSTGYAVREIFCLSTSDANRDALNCPPADSSEGLPMLEFASPENIARAEAAFAGLEAGEIRALFSGQALPVRDLAGQPVLADPAAHATSSADQMRDSLPPLIPDPAFGD
ncbi:MAG: hypothetical protein U9P68_12010 [Pseudomonadota bacterium]|nr:hypothetical protein [Pseudomonadota bacterium]